MSDLRSILNGIAQEHGGRLTPPLVLDAARDPDSPLHHRFEWDDTVAAEKFRLVQAGDLIRSVHVVYAKGADGPRQVRAFHAVRAADESQYNFEDVDVVMADQFKRKLVMADMQRQIAELVQRFERFDEFWRQLRKVARQKKPKAG